MANFTLGGFRPWGTLSGGEGVFPVTFRRELANNYATAIAKGDLIIPVSDGTAAIAAAANNDLLLGVVIGCSRVISGRRTPVNIIPANTTFSPTTVGSVNASWVYYYHLTPELILEVDADDGTTATTIATQIALIGENADMATGTPDATTGVSAFALDISTHATTTANFRIIDYVKSPTNDPTSSRFKFLVVCNEGFLPHFTASGV